MKLTLATILAARAGGRKAPPMSSYVYIHSERENRDQGIGNLYTVGFYDPAGKWQPESDHSSAELAAVRVAFLNGGAVTPSRTTPGPGGLPAQLQQPLPQRGQGSI